MKFPGEQKIVAYVVCLKQILKKLLSYSPMMKIGHLQCDPYRQRDRTEEPRGRTSEPCPEVLYFVDELSHLRVYYPLIRSSSISYFGPLICSVFTQLAIFRVRDI